jgi:5-methylcytosine-specific restriction enzyme subunit McrC
VELARLILRTAAFELRHGPVQGSAFLVDLNRVFEDFVVVALRDALGVTEVAFPQGAAGKGMTLDRGGAITLKPDLSWWEGRRCLFVGDVKYKRAGSAGGQQADLYQILAYAVAADLPGGLLVYAAGEGEPARHDVRHAGKCLEVVSVDLDRPPPALLDEVRAISGRIRTLRNEAARRSAAAG